MKNKDLSKIKYAPKQETYDGEQVNFMHEDELHCCQKQDIIKRWEETKKLFTIVTPPDNKTKGNKGIDPY